MKTLRILQIASHDRLRSGGSFQMMQAAIGLADRGHIVRAAFHRRSIFASRAHTSLDRLRRLAIETTSFRMRGIGRRASLRSFRRWVADESFDVVHVHRERALEFALDALGSGTHPLLVGQRGNSNAVSPRERQTFLHPRLRMIVTVANAISDRLIDGGIPSDRLTTIYGSVDLDLFSADRDGAPFRMANNIPLGAPVVGILANADGKKSHDVFFRAAAIVAERHADVRFAVVGAGDWSAARDANENTVLDGRVVFTGFCTDVPEAIAAFDVSVNSSDRGEGLTGAIRESLAMATPVVCTRVGGNEELVLDGETGRIVEPGDAEALADAIDWSLRNRASAKRLALSGRRFVETEMALPVRAARLEQLYVALLATR